MKFSYIKVNQKTQNLLSRSSSTDINSELSPNMNFNSLSKAFTSISVFFT